MLPPCPPAQLDGLTQLASFHLCVHPHQGVSLWFIATTRRSAGLNAAPVHPPSLRSSTDYFWFRAVFFWNALKLHL